MGEHRETGPLRPRVVAGTATRACPWLGSQRSRISSPANVVTHQNARATMPTRCVLADEVDDPDHEGEHPADGVHVEDPGADLEPAGRGVLGSRSRVSTTTTAARAVST